MQKNLDFVPIRLDLKFTKLVQCAQMLRMAFAVNCFKVVRTQKARNTVALLHFYTPGGRVVLEARGRHS